MMTRQSIDRLNGNCVCWVHDAWHHVSYIISKCIVLFPDACLLVWVWTFTQDSKGVVFYFVKMMQWDFPLSFPVMNLMNGNVFSPFLECVLFVCGSAVYYSSCQFCNQNWRLWFVDIIAVFSVLCHSCSTLIWPSHRQSASKRLWPIIT